LWRSGVDSEIPSDRREEMNEALVTLITAWVAGMGYEAQIKRASRGRRGQTPSHFPHIHDREGIHLKPEAVSERYAAIELVAMYDNLMNRLKPFPWKSRRTEYREYDKRGDGRALGKESVI